MNVLAALLLVLGLMLLLGYVVRRLRLVPNMAAPGQSRLQILETKPLDMRTRITLIRCDGKDYLIGQTGDSVLLLDRLDPPVLTQNGEAT